MRKQNTNRSSTGFSNPFSKRFSKWFCLIFCLGFVDLVGQEHPVSSLGRAISSEHLGELLIRELNCVACHRASAQIEKSLNSKQAPRLGSDGVALTPQFLREYLMQPHQVGQGRTMPDMLHGLGAQKESVVDALIHFLISLQTKEANVPIALDAFKMERGRQLFHSIGCIACHSPQESIEELASSQIKAPHFTGALGDRFAGEAVPIGDLSRKTSVKSLADFLENPLDSRPSGRMPSLNLSSSEALAIAMYLARAQASALFDPNQAPQKTRGLRFTYFEFGNDKNLSNEGSEDFAEHFPGNLPNALRASLQVAGSGTVDQISDAILKRRQQVGLIFSGHFTANVAGEYTFWTRSDDGSRLYIGSELVVQNDGDHGARERFGKIHLQAGDHPFKVTYYNRGGPGVLQVEYASPTLSRRAIAGDLFSHLGQAMKPLGEMDFVLNEAKIKKGKQHFTNYGCAQCHSIGEPFDDSILDHDAENDFENREYVAPNLMDLASNVEGGCLSDSPSARASRYSLRQIERQSLRDVLKKLDKFDELQSDSIQLSQTLNQLNCFACHSRGGRGGPTLLRAEYFRTKSELDLGDEGRLPPHLDGVGAKLHPDWMREVLIGRGSVRPYMATRMPQFGEDNVENLIHLFQKVDDPNPDDFEAELPLLDVKYGRRLLGLKGLACITCHTYDRFDSLGIPAIDLTKMTSRLKRSWFQKYLLNPIALRPGTRMPSFFPDGKSVNEMIFDGDADRQIAALWGFLKIADASNPPEGLVRGKRELIAENEAVMYRHWIEGAGARAIGVGYPEKANLAFDAEAMRLALIWQGAFIDTARHSTGRGVGFEPPLGHNVIAFPKDSPFAYLADGNASWPKAIGKEAGYQFKGYRLDALGRPTFFYSFRNVAIEDYSIAIATELDAKLHRSIRFTSPANVVGFWMKAAQGEAIELNPEGHYVVDGRLRLSFKLAGRRAPFVRKSGGRAELLVPVEFRKGEGKIEMEMIW